VVAVTAALVQQAQQGDEAAFEALIRAAYARLSATANHILRDSAAAEDATQDAIVRCWRDIRGLRDPDRFEPWLYRLLVNACRDANRRARRRPQQVFGPALEMQSGRDDVGRVAILDELDRAFDALQPDLRISLVLTHYLGYSAPEVASIVGVPVGTIYSRLHRATRAMRVALTTPAVPAAESIR
jgi:RNA polymerase sigma-70 factor (ECF subfamily)